MGIRNDKRDQLSRLRAKSLDEQFVALIRDGLNCSPFEAQAVLGAVQEVYGPYLGSQPGKALPGHIGLVAVDAEEPAGKPLASCAKRTVCLAVHRGEEDDAALQQGPMMWRRARIPDVCQQALSQGALLTREDLAYRVFYVSLRTISRDLAWLRGQQPPGTLPLRSMVQDIGPALSHRVEIVRLALEGFTTSEIGRRLYHSPSAVANYVETFIRCAQLHEQGIRDGQIAYLLGRSRGLVARYLALLDEARAEPARAHHLEQLLAVGRPGEKKRTAHGGHRHG